MSYSPALIAFTTRGNRVTIPCSVSPALGVQAQINLNSGQQLAGRFRIVNSSTQLVYLGWGSTPQEAQINAVSADGPNRMDMLPCTEVLSLPGMAYYSASVASGTARVTMTPGDGI